MPSPVKVESWDGLVSFLQSLPPVDIACRGEDKKNHEMKARIDRCLKLPDLGLRLRMERAVCQRFREHAPIYLSAVEQRYLDTRWLQLIVMQHYGAPTRLLDWTKSAWIAAFFAVSGSWESDGYMYCFRRDRLEECIGIEFISELGQLAWGPHPSDIKFSDTQWDSAKANNRLFDPKEVEGLSEWVATYYSREAHFPRLVAQQGLFTFGSRPGIDHWKQIRSLIQKRDCFVAQIKADTKPDILRRLNGVGLNGATLFPGPDGIGRSLEGFARAWHLDPPPSQL